MSEKIKIVYIGDDLGYWKKIQNDYKNSLSGGGFEYIRHEVENEWDPKTVFCEILDIKPNILYIDFALNPDLCLELSKYIRKDSTTKRFSTTALHQYNDFEKYLPKALMAGLRVNHIKSGEIMDVAYDGMCLFNVDKTAPPEFATAETQIITTVYQDLRVSYVDNNQFHIETKSPLTEGSILELNDHFLEEVMEHKNVEVTNQSDRNLYYDLRYSYDLKFEFAEQYNSERYAQVTDPAMLEKLKEQDAEKRLEKVQGVKKKIAHWLAKRVGEMSPPKKAKIMVIDRTLSFLRDVNIKLEKLDYTLILQSMLQGEREQLKRFMSHVVIYNFEKPLGGEQDDEFINGLTNLRAIIKTIEGIENYNPIVVVFNAGEEKGKIKSLIPYKKFLTYSEELSIDLVTNLAHKMISSIEVEEQKKIETESANTTSELKSLGPSHRVYFSSNDPESIIHLKRPIKIIEVNELTMYFECPDEIPSYTCFRIKHPFSSVLTVVPMPANSPHNNKPNVYYSLLNGIGEDEKKDVRQLINKLIFQKDHPPPEDDDGLSLWERREKQKAQLIKEEQEKARLAAEKAAAEKKAKAEEQARLKLEAQEAMKAKKEAAEKAKNAPSSEESEEE